MTESHLDAIRKDFTSNPHLRCVGCGSHTIVGTVVVEPEDDESRIDMGLPPDKVVCIGLCESCWDIDRDELLDIIALRIVPVEMRN